MEYTRTFVNRAEIEAPDVLYKYRSWGNALHRTILSLQMVYMAAPSSFEDKSEFKNFKQYELMSDEEIFQLYMMHSRINNPDFTDEQHVAHVAFWSKNTPLRNEQALKTHRDQFYKSYDQRIGVLSLTEYNDSLAMWNAYSAMGNGFCVGLDRKILFDSFQPFGSGGKVNYPDSLPVINGTDDFDVEKWKQTFNKEKKWEFEQEYRTTIFKKDGLSEKDRKVKLPKYCLQQVVLGWNMPLREKKRLVKVCNDAELNVKFLQASIYNNGVVLKDYTI